MYLKHKKGHMISIIARCTNSNAPIIELAIGDYF